MSVGWRIESGGKGMYVIKVSIVHLSHDNRPVTNARFECRTQSNLQRSSVVSGRFATIYQQIQLIHVQGHTRNVEDSLDTNGLGIAQQHYHPVIMKDFPGIVNNDTRFKVDDECVA
jgi:hypothetical protein